MQVVLANAVLQGTSKLRCRFRRATNLVSITTIARPSRQKTEAQPARTMSFAHSATIAGNVSVLCRDGLSLMVTINFDIVVGEVGTVVSVGNTVEK